MCNVTRVNVLEHVAALERACLRAVSDLANASFDNHHAHGWSCWDDGRGENSR